MSEEKVNKTEMVENKNEKAASRGPAKGQRGRARKGGDKRSSGNSENVAPEFEERVVSVNRCAKVVKGGRRFSFSALIVVGDKKGRVGHGLGKAKEVPEAIRKAKMVAMQKLIQVPVDNGTIPHEILGRYCSAKVLFKPAAEGTGVKAAGACRSVLELVGITNILTKSVESNNPHNIVKATFTALEQLRSMKDVATARGKEVKNFRLAQ